MTNTPTKPLKPLVFLDCETDGLHLSRRVWEVAAIRRDPDGSERTEWVMVKDPDLTYADSAGLKVGGFYDRHPMFSTPAPVPPGARTAELLTEFQTARVVERITRGAVVVGVNPMFDIDTLASLLRRHRMPAGWHYWPIDVKAMAVGRIGDLGAYGLASDDLSRACGVEPPSTLRHTALGDARWARSWFDAIASAQGREVA